MRVDYEGDCEVKTYNMGRRRVANLVGGLGVVDDPEPSFVSASAFRPDADDAVGTCRFDDPDPAALVALPRSSTPFRAGPLLDLLLRDGPDCDEFLALEEVAVVGGRDGDDDACEALVQAEGGDCGFYLGREVERGAEQGDQKVRRRFLRSAGGLLGGGRGRERRTRGRGEPAARAGGDALRHPARRVGEAVHGGGACPGNPRVTVWMDRDRGRVQVRKKGSSRRLTAHSPQQLSSTQPWHPRQASIDSGYPSTRTSPLPASLQLADLLFELFSLPLAMHPLSTTT